MGGDGFAANREADVGPELEVAIQGDGPRVLFVHGSVLACDPLFSAQRPLAERWTLAFVNRRGYGRSPAADGEDFTADADDIAELIEDGDHLVAFSYGGLGTMLAAARRASSVSSLALIEVPALDVARGAPVVESTLSALQKLHRRFVGDYAGYVRAFSEWVGNPGPLPDDLPPATLDGARLAYHQRPIWEAKVPLSELRDAPFPKLVVRGDGNPALGAVCDVLARELRAESIYVGGMGHMIPFAGPLLNDALEAFWARV